MSKNFRRSDGGGLLGNGTFSIKPLLIAHSLKSKDWERPKDIIKARHMANDGHTIEEIAAALGWRVIHATARRRLFKYRIFPFSSEQPRAHRGENTLCGGPRDGGINQTSYRPKVVA